MPSPVGHTITGLCGFVLARRNRRPKIDLQLLCASVAIANFPDIDILPGMLVGDPRAFHRQGSHSLIVGAIFGLLIGLIGLFGRGTQNKVKWSVWSAALYNSHILLDLLVVDSRPPYGVQALWPLSQTYFISPITIFQGFNYFDPSLGMVQSILGIQNLVTISIEIIVLMPSIWIFIYLYRSLIYRTSNRVKPFPTINRSSEF